MRENIIFEHPYTNESPVVNLFFFTISKWNNDKLSKLLHFITGSRNIPANGFKEYNEQGIPIRIGHGGNRNRLPIAHTSFHFLELPEYETEEEINEKFTIALQVESFGSN